MPERGFDAKRFKSEVALKYFVVSTWKKVKSEKRVVKRTVSNLFVKLKSMDSEIADLRLKLKSFVGFSNNWIQKMENWVLKSLGKVRNEVRSRLEKKLRFLRDRKIKEQESQKTVPKHKLYKKVV